MPQGLTRSYATACVLTIHEYANPGRFVQKHHLVADIIQFPNAQYDGRDYYRIYDLGRSSTDRSCRACLTTSWRQLARLKAKCYLGATVSDNETGRNINDQEGGQLAISHFLRKRLFGLRWRWERFENKLYDWRHGTKTHQECFLN